VAIKRWALSEPGLAAAVRDYLLRPEERSGALALLSLHTGELAAALRAHAGSSDDRGQPAPPAAGEPAITTGLLTYLVGRFLVQHEQHEQGIAQLQRAQVMLAAFGESRSAVPDAGAASPGTASSACPRRSAVTPAGALDRIIPDLQHPRPARDVRLPRTLPVEEGSPAGQATPAVEPSSSSSSSSLAATTVPAQSIRAIQLETLRLLGRAQYLVGRPEEAEESFRSLARAAPWSGWQAEALDWVERCRWAAARRAAGE